MRFGAYGMLSLYCINRPYTAKLSALNVNVVRNRILKML